MFNLLPGQGLGFSSSKEIAFGLGAFSAREISETPGGGFRFVDSSYSKRPIKHQTKRIIDNIYSAPPSDDEEIVEILRVLFELIGNGK